MQGIVNLSNGWVSLVSGETWFSILIGIFFTLVTFWIGLKKMSGAREERARASNEDLIQALIRLFVSRRKTIGFEEIQRLRDSKSRKYGVPPARLFNVETLLGETYARILENEYINEPEKETLLSQVEGSVANARDAARRTKPVTETSQSDVKPRRELILTAGSMVAGIAAAIASTLLPMLQNAAYRVNQLNQIFLLSVAVSVLGLGALLLLRLLDRRIERRREQEEMQRQMELLRRQEEFERHFRESNQD